MDTKGTLMVPSLDKSIRKGYEFQNWESKFKRLAVAKWFDSALEAGTATIFPFAYTDADDMPERTAGGKKRKKAMKAKNIAMAYLHMEVELGKATWWLAKACDDNFPNG